MFSTAVTRKPGKNFSQGITTSKLGKPNYVRMLDQYAAYIETLKQMGLDIIELEFLPEYPDAYFVEDVAVVTPDVAVITHPGAASRNGEQRYIEPVLSQFREIAHIQPPGTMDGGEFRWWTTIFLSESRKAPIPLVLHNLARFWNFMATPGWQFLWEQDYI